MTLNKKNTRKDFFQIRYKILITLLLGLTIFFLDYSIELGVASAVLYIVFVLSGLWYRDKKGVILLAIIAVLLTILGFYLSPNSHFEMWKVILNRIYAVLTIVVVAAFIYFQKIGLEKLEVYNLDLVKHKLELENHNLNMSQQINHLNKSALVSETDIKGNIIYANDKFCEVSGYLEEELLGKNHRILKSGHQPQGLFVGMWAAISRGKMWQGEICNQRKDGTFYWVMTTIAPFKNKKGKIKKYVAIRFEITSLKELEQKLKNRADELNSANKKLSAAFKELEMFSYSVSHDLKAPLRALQGFSKNLHKKYGNQLDETANRWINFIETNAERMDSLITDILTFSQINRTEIKKESIDMNDLVNKMFNQEKMFYTQPIKFNVDKLPIVCGDVSMMEMVWQNLIGNALKYSSKKETIEIVITGHEDKTHCHYVVKDNGVGFDMQHYDKLFNIFQRLHDNDEFAGTGVGLANINRIIQKHGGEIWAEAEIGKGAVFEFTIPKT